MPANLVIRAIARVAESAKGKKPPKQYKPTSIAYDQRTFCFIEPKEEISISTHTERLHIKLRLGNFQRGLLAGQKPTSATLSYKRSKKAFYINIVLEKEVVVPSGNNPVGIDRGLYNIATTTKGKLSLVERSCTPENIILNFANVSKLKARSLPNAD